MAFLKPATGSPVTTPQQDIALGCYYLTKYAETDNTEVKKFFSNVNEAKFAYQVRRISLKELMLCNFWSFTNASVYFTKLSQKVVAAQ